MLPHAEVAFTVLPCTVQVAGRLVPLTITLWNKIQARMLPTPAKFHYLFNMRELSKVFQGVILAARDRCGLHVFGVADFAPLRSTCK